jgi:Spy/CpxP family protein refolding chaperone
MARSRIFIAATIALSVAVAVPAAQAQAPAGGADAPKVSRLKMTREHIHDMLVMWRQNRPKFKACRAEARKKDLDGDDRWFFLEECMGKS